MPPKYAGLAPNTGEPCFLNRAHNEFVCIPCTSSSQALPCRYETGMHCPEKIVQERECNPVIIHRSRTFHEGKNRHADVIKW
jgi:hypothetical protein